MTLITRVSKLLGKENDEREYEPVGVAYGSMFEEEVRRPVIFVPDTDLVNETTFSWWEYSVFFWLGVMMLWAWNMFLAAAPYFQSRFAGNKSIRGHFQSAITSVSCITNLVSMLVLGQLQSKANYPKRILSSLIINITVFSLLALSTSRFRGVSEEGYLAFTLIMVFATSIATGLCQNGAFAFASRFARPEYIQAIMTGQAVAGVLPILAQIMSVLAIQTPDYRGFKEEAAYMDKENANAAFTFFVTAAIVSVITFLVVIPMIRKQNRTLHNRMVNSFTSLEQPENRGRKVVGMLTLYKKLEWLSAAVFFCYATTMFFPVFTQKVFSVVPEDKAPPLFRPSAYIPLGFLVWNSCDLLGRLLTLGPLEKLDIQPQLLFAFSILRIVFIPLYYLCNIDGKGAMINTDTFYLLVVQGGFGVTNGWLGSTCMMSASRYVDTDELEASGGFMAINLVAGLTAGSLVSFVIT